jgi:hypothetical protein
MNAADFAEAVRKAAGRYYVSRPLNLWRVNDRLTKKTISKHNSNVKAQSEADRLNNAAVLAMVGPLVAVAKAARDFVDPGHSYESEGMARDALVAALQHVRKADAR